MMRKGIQMANLITVNSAICHGKPCIRGLRYPVENVLEWLASGMSTEEILASLAYAARLSHVKRFERLVA